MPLIRLVRRLISNVFKTASIKLETQKTMQDQLLLETQAGFLLIEERGNGNSEIVIGAPHHTPGGTEIMPCPEHTDGDENTGFIARYLANNLNVPSIIAGNYRIDPNKTLTTDYSVQILKWRPKYLIEIHGHAGKGKSGRGKPKPDQNTIEISSGRENKDFSKRFADALQLRLESDSRLSEVKVNGDFDQIHFQAKNTATIATTHWTPLHIELPPNLRKDENNRLPELTTTFNEHLIQTIMDICE